MLPIPDQPQPTPDQAKPAFDFVMATQRMAQEKDLWAKTKALQPYIDRGQVVISRDTEAPGGITYYSTPGTEPGFALAHGGQLLLQVEGMIDAHRGRGSNIIAFTEHLRRADGKPTEMIKTVKWDSGGWGVSDRTKYEYHPNGQLKKTERKWNQNGGWHEETKNFDEQGKPV